MNWHAENRKRETAAALPGGEISISGSGFGARNHARPQVQFGAAEGSLVMAGGQFPGRARAGRRGGRRGARAHGRMESAPFPMALGVQIADNLHPVAIPPSTPTATSTSPSAASAAKKFPSRSTKSLRTHAVKPFITELMNPTGLAIDRDGISFCFLPQRRHRSTAFPPTAASMQWIEGMGIATGLAFDKAGNLYVGDRSGTIFKISPGARNFRVRHAGAFARGVSSGVQPGGRAVRHRAHHFEFRPRAIAFLPRAKSACFFAGWDVPKASLSTASAISTSRVRSAGKRGIVRLTPQAEAGSRPRRQQHRRARASALASRHDHHQQRSLLARLGRRRPSV